MSEALYQQKRLISIEASALAGMNPVLRRLTVREAVSECFRIEAEVLTTKPDLKPESVIGTPVTCSIEYINGKIRHFHGIVHRFARIGSSERDHTTYRLEARPRLFNLSRSRGSRIFEEKTPKDIVQEVVQQRSAGPLTLPSANPAKRRYCTQYDETDLEFVSRLIAESGWAYWFEHKKGDHTLHVAADVAGFRSLPETLEMKSPDDAGGLGTVWGWHHWSELPTGKVKTLDLDMPKSDKPSIHSSPALLYTRQASGAETFLYPSGRMSLNETEGEGIDHATDHAKLAMEGAEAAADLIEASGNAPEIFAGAKVKVKTSGGTLGCVVLEVIHEAMDDTHLAGGGEASYGSRVLLMPDSRPWRPRAPLRRPVIAGLQWATVTDGTDGNVDKYGRIKVKFPWEANGDPRVARWCNVLQGVAGGWGGMQFIPRTDDVVAVAFLNGDPDHPIVVGSVYADARSPPFPLPANKTQSGIKTKSIQGGGANILRFEDKAGSEEVHLQAEKDYDVLVKNDTTIYTKNDHTEKVKNNRTTTIEEGNEKLTVKMGNITEKVELGKTESEAMQSITLKVGQNSIVIDQTGITMKGLTIKIEGTIMLETKAPMAQHKGDAMMTIKGGIVMIN